MAESSHDASRKSLFFGNLCSFGRAPGEGQKQFPNQNRTPCRMRPVAWLVAASKGTPKASKVPAHLSLHSGLENRRTLIAFPGFESLVSRQDLLKSPAIAGLLRFWGLGVVAVGHLIVSASFQAVSATPQNLGVSGSASRSHPHAYKPSRLSVCRCAPASDSHRPGRGSHLRLSGGCRGTGTAGCSLQASRLPVLWL